MESVNEMSCIIRIKNSIKILKRLRNLIAKIVKVFNMIKSRHEK